MRERPILFAGPMVRAILSGEKTVTRRVMKPQPTPSNRGGHSWPCQIHQTMLHVEQELQNGEGIWDGLADSACPHGAPGDRLWVRETYGDAGCRLTYRADLDDGAHCMVKRWIPSIHMPRSASRILLEITAVRVERLQDGEGETAFESRYIAEGINRIHHGDGEHYYHPFNNEPGPGNWIDPFDAWRELWVSVNGAESWAANPWVWVVEFRRVAA